MRRHLNTCLSTLNNCHQISVISLIEGLMKLVKITCSLNALPIHRRRRFRLPLLTPPRRWHHQFAQQYPLFSFKLKQIQKYSGLEQFSSGLRATLLLPVKKNRNVTSTRNLPSTRKINETG